MVAEASVAGQEINTFEEYTLYSLDRTAPELLRMMECGKRIGRYWPGVGALVDAAGLCQEVASLACFQNSLSEVVGEVPGETGEKWVLARRCIHDVMVTLEETLETGDPDRAKQLFAMDLPDALNHFWEVIPGLRTHIRETFMSSREAPVAGEAGDEDEDV